MGLKEIQELKENARIPKQKKQYTIPKISDKKKKQLDKEKLEVLEAEAKIGKSAELDRWFQDRRKEMTGICKNCGGKTCRDDDMYYKFSIAHILPKAYFKSIKTNENNWIELCFWGNNCHAGMDNKMIDLMDMNCFDEIITKTSKMYPHIAQEERRRIPKVLIDYIETEL